MLLREHIIKALDFAEVGSALVIGDLLGEDKFRVLRTMRRLANEGLIAYFWDCPYEAEWLAADRLHFMSKETIRQCQIH